MSQIRTSSHLGSLILIFILLLSIGMANLYSASAELMFFNAQLKNMVVGLVAVIILGWLFPIKHVNTYGYLFYAFICLSLIIVLALGHKAGGAQRWIILGPLRFQPSEFAKLAVSIAVAKYFYHHRKNTSYQFIELWPMYALVLFVFALIFKQPDFGTAGICLLIALCQVAFIHIYISPRAFISLFFGGIAMGVIGWSFLLRPYQKLRILNLLNPNLDPSGSGYNSLQSLVAIGSGNLFGKGFLQGTQTQLQFLPARHTDFIFSVFAEEHGFWGSMFVFMLFMALTYIALEVGRNSRDTFNAFLAIGIAAFIIIEFALNVAMVLGLFPVVGMPFPFFSYGGSAMLTTCIAVGLLIAIDRENNKGCRSRRMETI